MASSNRKNSVVMSESRQLKPFEELHRTVMACLLWEDNFYEDGVSVADRINKLSSKCTQEQLEQLVRSAKFESKLRHVPLFLMVCMARTGKLKAELVRDIITRVDDMSELLAIYWKNGKKPIPNQMKKGLQMAFSKFDEYQFGKYKGLNRDIKLVDVINLVHPKPADKEHEVLWGKITNNNLATPDTWEVELSKTNDKKASWERLISEDRLGALATVRNISNMSKAGVDRNLIKSAIEHCHSERILPYQIYQSAKINTAYESSLDIAFLNSINAMDRLSGHTVILVDVSGSMDDRLTCNSDVKRYDVAACLASIAREICDSVSIYKFNNDIKPVPDRYGLALADCFKCAAGGTKVYTCINEAYKKNKDADRFIVITDEQDNGPGWWYEDYTEQKANAMKVGRLVKHPYIINVSTDKNGVCYANKNESWVHISGFSENVVKWIVNYENIR